LTALQCIYGLTAVFSFLQVVYAKPWNEDRELLEWNVMIDNVFFKHGI